MDFNGEKTRELAQKLSNKKFLEIAQEAKDVYDQAMFGESSERVTITWGETKIGFDKPVSCSIEDALEEIINTIRASDRGELKEWSDADMPTMHIDDFNDPEKITAHKKAMEKWEKAGGGLKPSKKLDKADIVEYDGKVTFEAGFVKKII